MARGGSFADRDSAMAFARKLARTSNGVVVKADGLAGGKGVTVCEDLWAAETAIESIFGADPGSTVVIEERLTGAEASLIAITDGSAVLALPPARDHKRLYDNDFGPNTGGMGAFSPLPDLPDLAAADLLETFHRPILAELARRGSPFRGALYAGLMLTPAGPRLLECNARFGDPETQALLPRLGVALGPLLLAAASGRLAAQQARLGTSVLPTTRQASVAVVLAAAGYPTEPRRGDTIEGLEGAAADALVFHAGTQLADGGRWQTNGGRILAVVGLGENLEAARRRAERAADAIHFAGAQRRRDIAAPAAVAAGASA
jgi:phosphoribosylamine--glycine ligase